MKNKFSMKRYNQAILRNLKRIMIGAISIVITFLLLAVIADVILKTLSEMYGLAFNRQMTFYDISILGGFFGGVIGAFVANFCKVCRVISRSIKICLDCLFPKGGSN